ncbi:hypothetical protein CGRA01v4_06763 [Colletotrichum graminicola]|nr:hypothetical protein CGRA01v4_06763 [Colletotrichum graminicola]
MQRRPPSLPGRAKPPSRFLPRPVRRPGFGLYCWLARLLPTRTSHFS